MILLYHRILRNAGEDPYFPHGVVSLGEFEEQIHFLRRQFEVVSLEEGFRLLRKKKKNTNRFVSVTFDDGWYDVWQNGAPLLVHLKIPAAFFLTTRFLDEDEVPWWERLYFLVNQPWAGKWKEKLGRKLRLASVEKNIFWNLFQKLKTVPDPERKRLLAIDRLKTPDKIKFGNGRLFMNWKEAQELARVPYFTIGAHGLTHERLSALRPREVFYEERGSKQILEGKLARKVDFFAYPFGFRGDINQVAIRGCRSAGFRAAFTAESGINSQRTPHFRLRRIPIGSGLKEKLFQAIVCHPETFLSWAKSVRWP